MPETLGTPKIPCTRLAPTSLDSFPVSVAPRGHTGPERDSMSEKEEPIVAIKLRVPQSLADRINIFRHHNMIDTRSEAINVLLEKALSVEEKSSGHRKK